jgi:OmcA/MtrC family decaheme c-type cytochrome
VSGAETAYPASATFNFVPAGGTASKIETVTDAACNTCHGVLEAHDRRRGTQLCITCHAGDRSTTYADPETQNTIDFRVMVHRIHSGQAGYHIVGFRQTDQDFSDVGFPQDVRNCTVCHSGANADNWKARPSAVACTSCHQFVKFDSSAAGACAQNHLETAPCNHVAGVTATTACNTCHAAGTALGPDTVHVNPALAAVASYKYEITGVTVGADRVPTVQYRVLQSGAPMALDADPWTHGSSSRLFVDIGWPSTEYDNQGSGQNFGQPVQINALPPSFTGGTATPVPGQTNVYQVVSPVPIPAGVNDITVALEGHPAIADPSNAGQFLRVPVPNDVKYLNASGAAGTARRQVVAVENCNKCHGLLSAHGNNRNGTTQVCAVCHNPSATDQARVPAGGVVEPIDFKVLVHEIHADKIRQTDVTIYGFGGSANVFPIGFPGQVGNCNICHVNNSFQLPLQAVVHDTIAPATSGTTPKTIAVCTACHDTVKFDNSATQACGTGVTGPCNHTGGVQTGDAGCAACHGAGSIADVAKVHPITAQ